MSTITDTESITANDDEVECVADTETRRSLRVFTRRSLRVLAENWVVVDESKLSEEIKDEIRDWMLNDMTYNQELSPELLEHVKQMVQMVGGGGTFDAKEEGE